MNFYLWFLFGLMAALFLFVLVRLFVKAGSMNIVFKILFILLLVILLLGMYYIATRYLGLFMPPV